MISGVPSASVLRLPSPHCLALHFSILLVALQSTKSFQSAMLPYATFPPKSYLFVSLDSKPFVGREFTF